MAPPFPALPLDKTCINMVPYSQLATANGKLFQARSRAFLLCKSIAKSGMCHFLAPAGQPEMMHKNFMHWHLHIFVMQRSCMKFYALTAL